jgi:hypothetical protein
MKWTPAEDAVLREHYASDWRRAAALLPHRSRSALALRAMRLGVTSRHRWTAEEDALLWKNWGHLPLGEVARIVGRSEVMTCVRAAKLGLGRGCPVGFEYFSAAVKRTGYTHVALHAILRFAGVRPIAAQSLTYGDSPTRHYVDPFDVDRAIAKWQSTESLAYAASRRGLAPVTLRKWLRDAVACGVAVPPRRQGRYWRIPSETIDAVVADRRGKETLAAAARRLGLPRQRLTRWLNDAGVSRPPMRLWLVAPEVANDVVRARMAMKLPGHQPGVRRAA